MAQQVKVSTRVFGKVANVIKICAAPNQDDLIASYTLLTISENSLKISATSEVLATTVSLPLYEELPELTDLEISFLVSAGDLANLVGMIEEDVTIFTYDEKKHAFSVDLPSASLTLSTKDAQEWVDIVDLFDPIASWTSVSRKLLRSVIGFCKFFLSSHQDVSMHLIEVRNGLALSTDRSKMGFLLSPDLQELNFSIPGTLVANIDKALEILQVETISVSESEAYTLVQSSSENTSITIGFAKSCTSLPIVFDQVPSIEESDLVSVDTQMLIKALQQVTVVAPRVDPRVKLSLGDSELVLTILNTKGLESFAKIPLTRIKGSTPASVVLPLSVFLKSIKRHTSSGCELSFTDTKYVKVKDASEVTTFSVFPSLPSLQS